MLLILNYIVSKNTDCNLYNVGTINNNTIICNKYTKIFFQTFSKRFKQVINHNK